MKNLALFHIGRGGHFNNPGYTTFVDFVDDSMMNNSVVFDRFSNDDKFVDADPSDFDGVAELDIDGNYNTYFTKDANDLDDDDIRMIIRDGRLSANQLSELIEANGYSPEDFDIEI